MTTNWAEIFGDEWAWVQKLGSRFTDPEEKKVFWETVREKKLTDPKYSVYTDFPRSNDIALEYCRKILAMLKGRPEKKREDA